MMVQMYFSTIKAGIDEVKYSQIFIAWNQDKNAYLTDFVNKKSLMILCMQSLKHQDNCSID